MITGNVQGLKLLCTNSGKACSIGFRKDLRSSVGLTKDIRIEVVMFYWIDGLLLFITMLAPLPYALVSQ